MPPSDSRDAPPPTREPEQRLAPGTDLAAPTARLQAAAQELEAQGRRRVAAGEPARKVLDDLLPALCRAVFAHPALSGPAHAAGSAELGRRAARLAEALGLPASVRQELDLAAVEARAEEGARSPSPSLEEAARSHRPKVTPDTALDYRPRLARAFEALPPAALSALPALLAALESQQKAAAASPGTRRSGNPALGGPADEYVPSDAELLAAELGDRARDVVSGAAPPDLARALAQGNVVPRRITYRRFSFEHADVMGSGRFFFASEPAEATVVLEPRR